MSEQLISVVGFRKQEATLSRPGKWTSCKFCVDRIYLTNATMEKVKAQFPDYPEEQIVKCCLTCSEALMQLLNSDEQEVRSVVTGEKFDTLGGFLKDMEKRKPKE